MKIVIDIQDDVYRVLKEDIYPIHDTERLALVFKTLVKKGTPLPKGHGRLIDADELKKIIQENDVLNMTGFNVRLCDINNTPTIIEADKAESEE